MKQLHSAQDAIEQAIEGGWIDATYANGDFSGDLKYQYFEVKTNGMRGGYHRITAASAFTDPLFWQALGKARGWFCFVCNGKGKVLNDFPATYDGEYLGCGNCKGTGYLGWENKAHDWFENRMVGGDESKFWESLQ